ncbi:hypothetical protein MPSEU_000149400 [Mayamaea pseudoterrestris]|nr:hypothetical protein MPSEU_000149400 [Mayamaea pseudoterrestris]
MHDRRLDTHAASIILGQDKGMVLSLTLSKRKAAARLCSQLLVLSVSLTGLFLCPYSKVEESFALQAIHDSFYFGLKPLLLMHVNSTGAEAAKEFYLLPYDHLQYPGVVPRTFAGPLIISALCRLTQCLLPFEIEHLNILARLFLLALQLHAWFRMARALDWRVQQQGDGATETSRPAISSPSTLGTYLLLVTAVQFHIPFYASRFLANSFATVMTLHAYSDWILGKVHRAACILVVAMTLLRCDLVLLLLPCGLVWLYKGQLTIISSLRLGIQSMLATIVLSVPVDSLLWQRLVWPEGVVLYENLVHNKSVEYGTSPWHWYVTSALPKSMLLTLCLVPLSFIKFLPLQLWMTNHLRNLKQQQQQQQPLAPSSTLSLQRCFDTTWLQFFLPAAAFVMLYSLLGHKEIRFLFPVLPLWNMAAAIGCQHIHEFALPDKDKPSSKIEKLSFGCMVLALLLSLVASISFVMVSSWNYPGGRALHRLGYIVKESLEHGNDSKDVHVYIDVAAAMTGVSLIGQRAAQVIAPNARWTFEKGGFEDEHAFSKNDAYEKYTHLLSETPDIPGFRVLEAVQGNPRLEWRHGQIVTSDAIYILGQTARTVDRLSAAEFSLN